MSNTATTMKYAHRTVFGGLKSQFQMNQTIMQMNASLRQDDSIDEERSDNYEYGENSNEGGDYED